MITIYNLKPKFQNLLRPLVKILYNSSYTANQVTILACIISIIYGLLLLINFAQNSKYRFIILFMPFIMFIRMALNAIDGMLAREFNQKSAYGAILNEMCDVISDTFLYLPFAILMNPILIIAFVISAIFSEMIGVVAITIGSSRRYDGPMGKSDRAFVFGSLSLILYFIDINKYSFQFNTILVIILVLTIFTIYNRGHKALLSIKDAN